MREVRVSKAREGRNGFVEAGCMNNVGSTNWWGLGFAAAVRLLRMPWRHSCYVMRLISHVTSERDLCLCTHMHGSRVFTVGEFWFAVTIHLSISNPFAKLTAGYLAPWTSLFKSSRNL